MAVHAIAVFLELACYNDATMLGTHRWEGTAHVGKGFPLQTLNNPLEYCLMVLSRTKHENLVSPGMARHSNWSVACAHHLKEFLSLQKRMA